MPLATYYALCAMLNLGMARASRGRPTRAIVWGIVAVAWGVTSVCCLTGRVPGLPEGVKRAIDATVGPATFFLGTFAALVTFFLARRFFTRPTVAWTGLNVSLAWLGLSMADPVFAGNILRPDNIPIVAMVYLLGFCIWLGTWQGVRNDERLARGETPVEATFRGRVYAWPDLMWIELLVAIGCVVVLMVWSLAVRAPLEAPADPTLTPAVAKAPWYFVGLQELLVYFDPSVAGVILPCLIVLGMMAIPYLDNNPRGNGYYTIRQRPFAWTVFLFGFLQLWISLILVGTFFRGPHWEFYGPYQPRDGTSASVSTVASDDTQVSLADWAWRDVLGKTPPHPTSDGGVVAEAGTILARESMGLIVLAVYFMAIPVVLARTRLRAWRSECGRGRYYIVLLLLLMMCLIPIKMLLSWGFHISHLVEIPEYGLYL